MTALRMTRATEIDVGRRPKFDGTWVALELRDAVSTPRLLTWIHWSSHCTPSRHLVNK